LIKDYRGDKLYILLLLIFKVIKVSKTDTGCKWMILFLESDNNSIEDSSYIEKS